MEFKDIQKKAVETMINYSKKYNVEIDKNFALIKLYEEVGEFSQAFLVHEKKSRPEKYITEDVSKNELAEELADIVGMAMVNAHLLDIDIEEAINKKWINKNKV